MSKVASQIEDGLNKAFSSITNVPNSDKFMAKTSLKNKIEEKDEEEETKEEAKEATGAGSSGSYSGPLMTSPIKNTLFQPGTEMKVSTKPKGGFVKEEKLEGGIGDNKTLMDLAKKHTKSKFAKSFSKERVQKMYDHLEGQLKKGIKVEMEHTDSKQKAKEIAMDHLTEDPNYYNKLARIHNEGEKVEAKEATTSASAGAYEGPAFLAKNKKNWKGGAKPIYKGGAFVEVKKKCKTFPYCNQGDINALNIWESEIVKSALDRASQKTGVDIDVIQRLFELEFKKKTITEDIELVSVEFEEDPFDTNTWEVSDKKLKFLRNKFGKKSVEFSSGDLSGKVTILGITPEGQSLYNTNSNFDETNQVKLYLKLSELFFKGQSVPVGFYLLINRYLPEEDELDSYRGNPVESAIYDGLKDMGNTLRYLSLSLGSIELD